jgi:hypothetical protein
MNFDTISHLKSLKYIFALVPLLTIACTQAMEQDSEIDDFQQTRLLVKTMHKESGITKLVALHTLHTKQAQRQLTEKMQTITQYAFLHHNALLRKAGGFQAFSGKPVTIDILNMAYCSLREQRKNNTFSWKDTQDIKKEFQQLTSQEVINVNVDAYQDDIGGKIVASYLLYCAENIEEVINFVANEYLQANKNLVIFSLIYSNAFMTFYPSSRITSDICKNIEKRIKTTKDKS